MSGNKDFSSRRYFVARLKPFAQPLFWLPLGIFSLALIGFWAYQQNPEWLGSVLEQPGISLEEEEAPVNQITNSPPFTAESPAVTPANPVNNNNVAPNSPTSPQPFNPLNTNTNTNNNQRPSLFAPLMPPIKQNTAPTNRKSLQPIQIRPITGGSTDYPLQREIENRLRTSNSNNSPNPNPAGNPNPVTSQNNYSPYQNLQPVPSGNNPNSGQIPYPANQSNYYQAPVYQAPVYGNQPNITGYPNQGVPPNYNGNPNQVPPQSPNRGFTIQQPIDARSPGY
jgi:hypothetical protein